MIRVVIGGARHVHLEDAVRVVGRRSDVEVVGVVDSDEECARRWAERFGAPAFGDWASVLAAEPGACLVYSETSLHEAYVEAAAAAGVAVFVEKPLAVEPVAARRVAAHLDPRAQVGFFLRYCPAIRSLVRLVRDDALGGVGSVSARFVHDGWSDGRFDGEYRWMAAPAEGGGGFFDLAVHCLDLLELVGGVIQRVERVDLAGAHHGTASVHLARGATGRIEAGWEGETLGIELEVCGDRRRARVCGGELLVDGERVLEGPPPAAGDAIDVFFDRLAGRTTHERVDPATAVRNCEAIDRLRRARC